MRDDDAAKAAGGRAPDGDAPDGDVAIAAGSDSKPVKASEA
jgi:hypothetical protein